MEIQFVKQVMGQIINDEGDGGGIGLLPSAPSPHNQSLALDKIPPEKPYGIQELNWKYE